MRQDSQGTGKSLPQLLRVSMRQYSGCARSPQVASTRTALSAAEQTVRERTQALDKLREQLSALHAKHTRDLEVVQHCRCVNELQPLLGAPQRRLREHWLRK